VSFLLVLIVAPCVLGKSKKGQKGQKGQKGKSSGGNSGSVSGFAGTASSGACATYVGHSTFASSNLPWNKAVDAAALSPQSSTIINWLSTHGGWGTGLLKIDFSITVLESSSSSDLKTFNPTGDFYTPDCDHVPFPLPSCGSLEGESGYTCTTDGDCHLIVIYHPTNTLYEMWRANVQSGTFNGGCAAKWPLNKNYTSSLRGEQCTSADAGGFPLSALLFDADEIAAGSINHAIRFILPNARIRNRIYVHPATHSTFATTGDVNSAPPYGVRLRLKSSYNISGLSAGAQVVAKALKKYGMILSDGGNIALTGASDQYTAHKWANVGVNSNSLSSIPVTAFEVVAWPDSPIHYTGDCIRNP